MEKMIVCEEHRNLSIIRPVKQRDCNLQQGQWESYYVDDSKIIRDKAKDSKRVLESKAS